ncbi:Rtr1/RPAP2 family-domain-containing protein, partial [Massariosphaeria phaeospora]
ALNRANDIQNRKEVERDVLEAVLALMELPTAPDADPANPSAADARHFREAIIPFTPADYDSLIEERNIVNKCGYTLCPGSKGKARSNAPKQVIRTDHGLDIVDRKVVEMWCSKDCARRALYVKVQLNEEPAWMRLGGVGNNIDLMVDKPEELRSLPLLLKKPDAGPAVAVEGEDAAAAWAARDDALADLAAERGEKGRLSKANKDLLQDRIRENVASAPPEPPTLSDTGYSHLAIEGHVPNSTLLSHDDNFDEQEQ